MSRPGVQPLHTFSLVTADRPGVLVRIALVFARRGYNIESLAVSPGAMEGFARLTI
jgi:acetolactate synthase I/III small subunit